MLIKSKCQAWFLFGPHLIKSKEIIAMSASVVLVASFRQKYIHLKFLHISN